MNQSNDDDLIRESYERNSPTVDVDAAWEMLKARMDEAERQEESPVSRPAIRLVSTGDDQRQSSARTVSAPRASASGRRSGLRVAVGVSFAIILLAAIAVGSLEAVHFLGNRQPVVVIGDGTDDISPGSTGTATATTAASAVSPPTTDSPFPLETRLPNGHFRGLVYVIYMDYIGDYRTIKVDFIEMLTGEEARTAAIEDGVISPGEDLPQDYYIRNLVTPAEEGREAAGEWAEGDYGPGFVLNETVSITTYTFGEGGEKTITWEQFASFWHPTSPPEGGEHMHDVPWWVERDERGKVVSITECVLP